MMQGQTLGLLFQMLDGMRERRFLADQQWSMENGYHAWPASRRRTALRLEGRGRHRWTRVVDGIPQARMCDLISSAADRLRGRIGEMKREAARHQGVGYAPVIGMTDGSCGSCGTGSATGSTCNCCALGLCVDCVSPVGEFTFCVTCLDWGHVERWLADWPMLPDEADAAARVAAAALGIEIVSPIDVKSTP